MAYTRFNGKHYMKTWFGKIPPSETYIIGTRVTLECLGCRLNGYGGYFSTTSRHAMLKHMAKHRKARHAVPRSAIKRLQRDIQKKGDVYP